MPAKSQAQRGLIFGKRNQYKTKKNTPKKWKWIWDEDYENKGKLPEKVKESFITKFKIFEERYLSDDEIEASYDDFEIVSFSVDSLSDRGGASGWISIEFPYDEENDYAESKTDHWIKYDSGPTIAFDNWYPEKMNIQLKEYIEKGIKEYKLLKNADKYNL